MLQEKNQVLWNEHVRASYYKVGIACQKEYSDARPGQFVTLRFGDQLSPLLRRPFSIHRQIKASDGHTEGIELLYRVVGNCTRTLSTYEKGETLDILGPLGNSFSVPDHARRVFMVGGGIGVAPMCFLAESLRDKAAEPSECEIFIGGRSLDDLLCHENFSDMGMTVHLTTDDGSGGEKGLVTVPLERVIKKASPDVICACGPEPMLKAVAQMAKAYGIPCQLSLETVMACGLGACLGCALEGEPHEEKYKHVCADGPIFDAKAIRL